MRVIGDIFLAYGIFYALFIVRRSVREREAIAREKGSPALAFSGEAAVFFLSASGFPDFVMNTLFLRQSKLVKDEQLPATLMAATVTPGCIIAFSYLQNSEPIDLKTLLLCAAAVALGCFTGSFLVGIIPKGMVRIVMGVALIGTMTVLALRMLFFKDAGGTATALTNRQFALALPCIFLAGIINMCGVPTKPILTALFLLCGMSPITTLTVMLTLAGVGPIAGSFKTLQRNAYAKKITLAAATAGAAGAVLGCRFMLAIPSDILNVLLLAIMGVTAVTLLRRKRSNS